MQYNDNIGLLQKPPEQKYNDDIGLFQAVAAPEYNDDIGLLQEKPEQKYNDDIGLTDQPGLQQAVPAPKAIPELPAKMGIVDPNAALPPSEQFIPIADTRTGKPITKPEIPDKNLQERLQETYGTYGKNIPKEMLGYIARPVIDLARGFNWLLQKGTDVVSDVTGLEKGGAFDQAAQQLTAAKEEMTTPLTDPTADLAVSMVMGGGGAALSHKLMSHSLPWIMKGSQAVKATTAIGAGTAAVGDFAINRVLEKFDPIIEQSDLSDAAKTGIRMTVPLMLGFLSAATLETRMAKSLGDPFFARQINHMVKGGASPEDIINRFKQTGQASDWSPEISAKQTAKMAKAEVKAKARVKPTAPIDKAAQEAATSPKSAAPIPTEAQITAGNYKKGHVKLHGLDISIENPRGSTRSGTDQGGKEWSVTMKDHYGYIKETVGKDKDHLDVFIGRDPESKAVFVVDQINPKTGKFDEHKVLMGYKTTEEAKAGYLANYEEGWQGIGNIKKMKLDDFKAWTKAGDTTKAIGFKGSKVQGSGLKKAVEVKTTPKDKEYFINTRGKGIKKVDARPVSIEGLDKYDLFYHKDAGDFTITEATTGQRIASNTTLKGAKEKALKVLTDNKDKIDKIIKKAPKIKDIKAKAQPTTLHVHPSTVLGTAGGAAYGIEADDEGNITINPKKALIGMATGAAVGAGYRPGKVFAHRVADKWDDKIATPILEAAKRKVNSLIVNEDIRFQLGLDRSKKFGDVMRNYKRETELLWKKAAQLGEELAEIAPTKLEQRRLMQVLKGGISANPETVAKAKKVQGLFNETRSALKKHDLLQYSQFDNLTRKQRAALRKTISGRTDAKPEDIEIARQRLHDHYHVGSAKEYAPLMYSKHEGFSPQQRQVVKDEIVRLKTMSRKANPEGTQELEEMIAGLEGLIGKKTTRIRPRQTQLDLGYSHRRQDMPVDIQRMMGKIEEAPYPIAKGVGTQTTDIRKARLFEDISEHPDWAFTPQKGQDLPANYTRIKDDRFGALNGMAVRRDVWEDLKEVEEWRSNFVRNWDKVLGWWKYGKVVLNPATHARNFMSNTVLAYFGDVNPGDVKTYSKAAKAMKAGAKDKFFKEAEDWGLFNDTFYSAEINKLRDELGGLRDPKAMKTWIRKAFSLPSQAYQGSEKFFKMAVFIKARSSGMPVDVAARKAEYHIFNYADTTPWVKHMKRWVSPFFTFTFKALPVAGEMAIRNPWKMAAIGASIYGLEQFAQSQLGYGKQEAKEKREMLPEWQRGKVPPGVSAHPLMPFRDKWGNDLYWDLSYVLPYGTIAEQWGQSRVPLRDVLPNHPLMMALARLASNRDLFTGKDISNEYIDSIGTHLMKHAEYAWRDLTPSLAPGGYSFNKLKTGFTNLYKDKPELDWADRPVELQNAILDTLLGVKLRPANYEKLKRNEMFIRRQIGKEISGEVGRLKRKYHRNEIDKSKYQDQSKRLFELKKEILEERSK